jgi:hypothetical protein
MPEMPTTATAIGALVIVALISYVLRRFGILPMSPTEAASIARADRAEGELAKANQRIGELEQSKSLKPVLELLRDAAHANAQVLEKLAAFNGSLHRINVALAESQRGLHEATEAIKFVSGLVVGANELNRLKPPE